MNAKQYYQNKVQEMQDNDRSSADNTENLNEIDNNFQVDSESDNDVSISYTQKRNFDTDEPDLAGKKSEINSKRYGRIGMQG